MALNSAITLLVDFADPTQRSAHRHPLRRSSLRSTDQAGLWSTRVSHLLVAPCVRLHRASSDLSIHRETAGFCSSKVRPCGFASEMHARFQARSASPVAQCDPAERPALL